MGSKPALTRQAVLTSFDVGVSKAAEIYDLDEEDLADYRRLFLKSEYESSLLDSGLNGAESNGERWIERVRQNPYYLLSAKIVMAVVLILISWAMPALLQPYVDPLTNTVVWMGFTSLYLLTFVGLGIDLVLWIQHHVDFDFLNPLKRTGDFDYSTLIRSNQLSAFEKCKLSQQKYLAYLAAFCAIIWALASLTSGGGN